MAIRRITLRTTGLPFRPTAANSQRLIDGERLIHYADVAAVPAEVEAISAMSSSMGARTVLLIPLRKDGTYVGGISALRTEVKPFTEAEISLLESFAAQAVIAIENARLLTEQREALEQQTATAEVLQVINRSPGDLTPVFDAMLEKALRLCDAAFGNLWTYDGEVGRLAAICGASPEYRAELMRAGPQKPEPGASLIRLVEGEPLIHIADITAEGAYRSGAAVRRMLADRAGARTVLWVPMRKDGALLGFFTIYRTEVRPFTDKQIALLQNFAAQAVIAMENARLLNEQRPARGAGAADRDRRGAAGDQLGRLAISKPVFDAMLEKAHALCEAAKGSILRSKRASYHPSGHRRILNRAQRSPAQHPTPPGRGTSAGRIAVRTDELFTLLMRRPIRRIGEAIAQHARAEYAHGAWGTAAARTMRCSGVITVCPQEVGRSPISRSRCWRISPPRR